MKASKEIKKYFTKQHIKKIMAEMMQVKIGNRFRYELDGYTIDEVVNGIALAEEAIELRNETPYHKHEFKVMLRFRHIKTNEWMTAPCVSCHIDVYADDSKFPGLIKPYTAARGIHSTIDDVVKQAVGNYLRTSYAISVKV